jgi:hypothetical protein
VHTAEPILDIYNLGTLDHPQTGVTQAQDPPPRSQVFPCPIIKMASQVAKAMTKVDGEIKSAAAVDT